MVFKKIFTSLIFLGLTSVSSIQANPNSGAEKKQGMKEKLVKLSFEDCCDQQYGDSDSCHKQANVTGKTKTVKGTKVKKECFVDSEEDDYSGE